MSTPEWLREGALGVLLTALLAACRGLFNAGKRQREFEDLKQDVQEVRIEQCAQGKDLGKVREQVAEIHGWMKARNGFTPPRHGA